jgi:RNA exonuclease 1
MPSDHKRKFGEYHQDARRSTNSEDYTGVGQLLGQLKQPSYGDTFQPARSSEQKTSPHGSRPEDDSLPSDSHEWQIAARKHTQKPKRKRAGDEKDRTKYPELTCHGKVSAPIRITDLQALTLYTLADGVAPNWVAFKHAHHTRKVVALMVPGLEKGMLDGTISINNDFDLHMGHGFCRNGREKNSVDNSEQNENEFHAWKNGRTIKAVKEGNPSEIHAESLPHALQPLAEIFEEVWPVKAPGDSRYSRLHSPIQAMLISLLPRSKENTSMKGPKPPAEEKDWRSHRTPITEFIHTVDELREAEYPLHPALFDGDNEAALLEQERRGKTGQNFEAGWVDTRIFSLSDCDDPSTSIQQGSISAGRTVYAVDCEMVLTTDDKYSLARISVVDWNGKTVLDELVKPSLPIKNYFTQYSGMTEALLDPVKTGLVEVQSKLLSLFTTQSILLGHSLESDLSAMKLTHPFIIDTSLIYPHPRGPPLRSSLKFLAQKYLRRDIQQQDSKGHNSVEDALAVLDLVKLKCEKGPRWGTSEASGEPIFRRLARKKKKDAGGNERGVTSAMVDYGTPERGYGKEATVQIGCGSDLEIVKAVARVVNGDSDGKIVPGGGVDFTWGRLRELESFREWCNNNREYASVDKLHDQASRQVSVSGHMTEKDNHTSPDSLLKHGTVEDTAQKIEATMDQPSPASSNEQPPQRLPTPSTLKSTIASTVSHIRAIYDALPPCTLFIVYTGTGDPREVGRLQKMQQQFRKEFKVKKWDDLSVKWTDDEEQALKMAVDRAREGIGLLCVK